jgi:hypothetical protein
MPAIRPQTRSRASRPTRRDATFPAPFPSKLRRQGNPCAAFSGDDQRPGDPLASIAAGALAALGSAKLLEKLVFGVSASDPLTLAAVAGVLTVVALVASLVPAYRASRLDPIEVLRAD